MRMNPDVAEEEVAMTPFPARIALAACLASLAALSPLVVAAPAAAQGARTTVAEVLALVARSDGRTKFTGKRSQQVIRQDMILDADAKVDFIDNQNYAIGLQNPADIKGLNLVVEKNRLTAFFPKETLLFQSDTHAGADEVKDLVMGNLTTDQAAITRNYTVTVAPEMDIVALYPCYKITAEPARGFGPQSPPGHRFWVARENGLVMKEERYWGADQAAYFVSKYDQLSLSAKPSLALTLPKQVNRLRLQAGTPTEMRRFPTVEAARAAGKKVFAPSSIPAGFVLRSVDVMGLYGTDIILLRYNDGLSNMVVTYRTKPNAFLTLMAGAFALSLVEKISALSYHAPNNYAVIEKGDYLIYAYGDMWVDTLKSICNTVPVPSTPQGARTTAS